MSLFKESQKLEAPYRPIVKSTLACLGRAGNKLKHAVQQFQVFPRREVQVQQQLSQRPEARRTCPTSLRGRIGPEGPGRPHGSNGIHWGHLPAPFHNAWEDCVLILSELSTDILAGLLNDVEKGVSWWCQRKAALPFTANVLRRRSGALVWFHYLGPVHRTAMFFFSVSFVVLWHWNSVEQISMSRCWSFRPFHPFPYVCSPYFSPFAIQCPRNRPGWYAPATWVRGWWHWLGSRVCWVPQNYHLQRVCMQGPH